MASGIDVTTWILPDMITLCEVGFPDGTHVPFNAGLLATIRAAFPKETLSFFGSATHIEGLKQQVGQALAETVLWKVICPPSLGTSYFKRFALELLIIRRLINMVSGDLPCRFLFTSAYPSTVLALKLARLFRPDNIPVQIVLHGLSGVVGRRYRRPIRRFQDMKTALTILGNNSIQYLVLEQSIRDTVLKSLPFLSGKIEALDHPISPNEGKSQTTDLSEPIRFGFLGLAIKPKGFPLFVELANEVIARHGRRAEFHAIGRFPEDGRPVNGIEVLATKPDGARLMSRAKFIQGVTPLHFILLLHEGAPYTLSASGILLDAIAWEKPVIARRIPIFEAMSEKHGDIGYMFGDDTELRDIVDQIVRTPDTSRYRRQVINLRSARKSRSPETLATSYREICRTSEGAAR